MEVKGRLNYANVMATVAALLALGGAAIATMALSGVVQPGRHTLTLALDCPTGIRMGTASSGKGELGARGSR